MKDTTYISSVVICLGISWGQRNVDAGHELQVSWNMYLLFNITSSALTDRFSIQVWLYACMIMNRITLAWWFISAKWSMLHYMLIFRPASICRISIHVIPNYVFLLSNSCDDDGYLMYILKAIRYICGALVCYQHLWNDIRLLVVAWWWFI